MQNILLQKQVRDNSQDLRNYLQDLGKWEEDMKRKEDELNDKDVVAEVPLVRNKSAKTKENKPTNVEKGKSKAKLKSYSAWDKFDVEKELEKIDSPKEPEKEESDNEDVSEEYKTRIREEAMYEKERGNQFVKNKKWSEAITCYTHAIACYGKDPVFYANRALCFLKKEDYSSAEADCTSSLQLDSTYVKALQRRAAARIGRKQLLEALGDLSRVLELEPHNNESKKELQKLEKQLGVPQSKIDAPKTPEIPISKQTTLKSFEPPKNKIEIKEHLIPWPKRAHAENVLAIRKLPHQRSKKPIKRIEITESDSNDISLNNIENIEQIAQNAPKDTKNDLITPIETHKCSKVAPNTENASKEASNIEQIAQKSPNDSKNDLITPTEIRKYSKVAPNTENASKEASNIEQIAQTASKNPKNDLITPIETRKYSKVAPNTENASKEDSNIEQIAQNASKDPKNDLITPIETRKCSKVAPNTENVTKEASNIEQNAEKSPKYPKNDSITQNVQKLPNGAKDSSGSIPENKGFKIEQKPELFDLNCSPETIKLGEIVKNVPKTSVQFYTNWKTMGNDLKLKQLYLRNINPVELPNIFRDSMECDVFSEIIQILYTFMKLIPNVCLFVENLAKVKRFSALTMFMSRDDKKALENIFQYCEADEKLSKENINNLRIKYEL